MIKILGRKLWQFTPGEEDLKKHSVLARDSRKLTSKTTPDAQNSGKNTTYDKQDFRKKAWQLTPDEKNIRMEA
jgi:hypothetical protein